MGQYTANSSFSHRLLSNNLLIIQRYIFFVNDTPCFSQKKVYILVNVPSLCSVLCNKTTCFTTAKLWRNGCSCCGRWSVQKSSQGVFFPQQGVKGKKFRFDVWWFSTVGPFNTTEGLKGKKNVPEMQHLQLLSALPRLHVLYTYTTLTLHLHWAYTYNTWPHISAITSVTCTSWHPATPFMELSISLVPVTVIVCELCSL